jgi:hypothetical protein
MGPEALGAILLNRDHIADIRGGFACSGH